MGILTKNKIKPVLSADKRIKKSLMKRIMYIECKSGDLDGPGRIGWVEFSRTMRSFYYRGKRFEKTRSGYKYNCFEASTGATYWISGPKKNGEDTLYGGIVEIDED